jgi:hypothetical protein
MNTNIDNNTAVFPGADMSHDEKLAALEQKTLANGHAACLGRGEFYAVNLRGNHLFVPVESYEGFAAAFLGAE